MKDCVGRLIEGTIDVYGSPSFCCVEIIDDSLDQRGLAGTM